MLKLVVSNFGQYFIRSRQEFKKRQEIDERSVIVNLGNRDTPVVKYEGKTFSTVVTRNGRTYKGSITGNREKDYKEWVRGNPRYRIVRYHLLCEEDKSTILFFRDALRPRFFYSPEGNDTKERIKKQIFFFVHKIFEGGVEGGNEIVELMRGRNEIERANLPFSYDNIHSVHGYGKEYCITQVIHYLDIIGRNPQARRAELEAYNPELRHNVLSVLFINDQRRNDAIRDLSSLPFNQTMSYLGSLNNINPPRTEPRRNVVLESLNPQLRHRILSALEPRDRNLALELLNRQLALDYLLSLNHLQQVEVLGHFIPERGQYFRREIQLRQPSDDDLKMLDVLRSHTNETRAMLMQNFSAEKRELFRILLNQEHTPQQQPSNTGGPNTQPNSTRLLQRTFVLEERNRLYIPPPPPSFNPYQTLDKGSSMIQVDDPQPQDEEAPVTNGDKSNVIYLVDPNVGKKISRDTITQIYVGVTDGNRFKQFEMGNIERAEEELFVYFGKNKGGPKQNVQQVGELEFQGAYQKRCEQVETQRWSEMDVSLWGKSLERYSHFVVRVTVPDGDEGFADVKIRLFPRNTAFEDLEHIVYFEKKNGYLYELPPTKEASTASEESEGEEDDEDDEKREDDELPDERQAPGDPIFTGYGGGGGEFADFISLDPNYDGYYDGGFTFSNNLNNISNGTGNFPSPPGLPPQPSPPSSGPVTGTDQPNAYTTILSKKDMNSKVRMIPNYMGLLPLFTNPSYPWHKQGGIVLENCHEGFSVLKIHLGIKNCQPRDISIRFQIHQVAYIRGNMPNPLSVVLLEDSEELKGPKSDPSLFKPLRKKTKKKTEKESMMEDPQTSNTIDNPSQSITKNGVLTLEYRLNNFVSRKPKGINHFSVTVFVKGVLVRSLGYYFKKDNRTEAKNHVLDETNFFRLENYQIPQENNNNNNYQSLNDELESHRTEDSQTSEFQYPVKDLLHATLLHYYVAKGKLGTVKFLVDEGYSFRQRDWCGITPLMVAVYFNRYDILNFFMEQMEVCCFQSCKKEWKIDKISKEEMPYCCETTGMIFCSTDCHEKFKDWVVKRKNSAPSSHVAKKRLVRHRRIAKEVEFFDFCEYLKKRLEDMKIFLKKTGRLKGSEEHVGDAESIVRKGAVDIRKLSTNKNRFFVSVPKVDRSWNDKRRIFSSLDQRTGKYLETGDEDEKKLKLLSDPQYYPVIPVIKNGVARMRPHSKVSTKAKGAYSGLLEISSILAKDEKKPKRTTKRKKKKTEPPKRYNLVILPPLRPPSALDPEKKKKKKSKKTLSCFIHIGGKPDFGGVRFRLIRKNVKVACEIRGRGVRFGSATIVYGGNLWLEFNRKMSINDFLLAICGNFYLTCSNGVVARNEIQVRTVTRCIFSSGRIRTNKIWVCGRDFINHSQCTSRRCLLYCSNVVNHGSFFIREEGRIFSRLFSNYGRLEAIGNQVIRTTRFFCDERESRFLFRKSLLLEAKEDVSMLGGWMYSEYGKIRSKKTIKAGRRSLITSSNGLTFMSPNCEIKGEIFLSSKYYVKSIGSGVRGAIWDTKQKLLYFHSKSLTFDGARILCWGTTAAESKSTNFYRTRVYGEREISLNFLSFESKSSNFFCGSFGSNHRAVFQAVSDRSLFLKDPSEEEEEKYEFIDSSVVSVGDILFINSHHKSTNSALHCSNILLMLGKTFEQRIPITLSSLCAKLIFLEYDTFSAAVPPKTLFFKPTKNFPSYDDSADLCPLYYLLYAVWISNSGSEVPRIFFKEERKAVNNSESSWGYPLSEMENREDNWTSRMFVVNAKKEFTMKNIRAAVNEYALFSLPSEHEEYDRKAVISGSQILVWNGSLIMENLRFLEESILASRRVIKIFGKKTESKRSTVYADRMLLSIEKTIDMTFSKVLSGIMETVCPTQHFTDSTIEISESLSVHAKFASFRRSRILSRTSTCLFVTKKLLFEATKMDIEALRIMGTSSDFSSLCSIKASNNVHSKCVDLKFGNGNLETPSLYIQAEKSAHFGGEESRSEPRQDGFAHQSQMDPQNPPMTQHSHYKAPTQAFRPPSQPLGVIINDLLYRWRIPKNKKFNILVHGFRDAGKCSFINTLSSTTEQFIPREHKRNAYMMHGFSPQISIYRSWDYDPGIFDQNGNMLQTINTEAVIENGNNSFKGFQAMLQGKVRPGTTREQYFSRMMNSAGQSRGEVEHIINCVIFCVDVNQDVNAVRYLVPFIQHAEKEKDIICYVVTTKMDVFLKTVMHHRQNPPFIDILLYNDYQHAMQVCVSDTAWVSVRNQIMQTVDCHSLTVFPIICYTSNAPFTMPLIYLLSSTFVQGMGKEAHRLFGPRPPGPDSQRYDGPKNIFEGETESVVSYQCSGQCDKAFVNTRLLSISKSGEVKIKGLGTAIQSIVSLIDCKTLDLGRSSFIYTTDFLDVLSESVAINGSIGRTLRENNKSNLFFRLRGKEWVDESESHGAVGCFKADICVKTMNSSVELIASSDIVVRSFFITSPRKIISPLIQIWSHITIIKNMLIGDSIILHGTDNGGLCRRFMKEEDSKKPISLTCQEDSIVYSTVATIIAGDYDKVEFGGTFLQISPEGMVKIQSKRFMGLESCVFAVMNAFMSIGDEFEYLGKLWSKKIVVGGKDEKYEKIEFKKESAVRCCFMDLFSKKSIILNSKEMKVSGQLSMTGFCETITLGEDLDLEVGDLSFSTKSLVVKSKKVKCGLSCRVISTKTEFIGQSAEIRGRFEAEECAFVFSSKKVKSSNFEIIGNSFTFYPFELEKQEEETEGEEVDDMKKKEEIEGEVVDSTKMKKKERYKFRNMENSKWVAKSNGGKSGRIEFHKIDLFENQGMIDCERFGFVGKNFENGVEKKDEGAPEEPDKQNITPESPEKSAVGSLPFGASKKTEETSDGKIMNSTILADRIIVIIGEEATNYGVMETSCWNSNKKKCDPSDIYLHLKRFTGHEGSIMRSDRVYMIAETCDLLGEIEVTKWLQCGNGYESSEEERKFVTENVECSEATIHPSCLIHGTGGSPYRRVVSFCVTKLIDFKGKVGNCQILRLESDEGVVVTDSSEIVTEEEIEIKCDKLDFSTAKTKTASLKILCSGEANFCATNVEITRIFNVKAKTLILDGVMICKNETFRAKDIERIIITEGSEFEFGRVEIEGKDTVFEVRGSFKALEGCIKCANVEEHPGSCLSVSADVDLVSTRGIHRSEEIVHITRYWTTSVFTIGELGPNNPCKKVVISSSLKCDVVIYATESVIIDGAIEGSLFIGSYRRPGLKGSSCRKVSFTENAIVQANSHLIAVTEDLEMHVNCRVQVGGRFRVYRARRATLGTKKKIEVGVEPSPEDGTIKEAGKKVYKFCKDLLKLDRPIIEATQLWINATEQISILEGLFLRVQDELVLGSKMSPCRLVEVLKARIRFGRLIGFCERYHEEGDRKQKKLVILKGNNVDILCLDKYLQIESRVVFRDALRIRSPIIYRDMSSLRGKDMAETCFVQNDLANYCKVEKRTLFYLYRIRGGNDLIITEEKVKKNLRKESPKLILDKSKQIRWFRDNNGMSLRKAFLASDRSTSEEEPSTFHDRRRLFFQDMSKGEFTKKVFQFCKIGREISGFPEKITMETEELETSPPKKKKKKKKKHVKFQVIGKFEKSVPRAIKVIEKALPSSIKWVVSRVSRVIVDDFEGGYVSHFQKAFALEVFSHVARIRMSGNDRLCLFDILDIMSWVDFSRTVKRVNAKHGPKKIPRGPIVARVGEDKEGRIRVFLLPNPWKEQLEKGKLKKDKKTPGVGSQFISKVTEVKDQVIEKVGSTVGSVIGTVGSIFTRSSPEQGKKKKKKKPGQSTPTKKREDGKGHDSKEDGKKPKTRKNEKGPKNILSEEQQLRKRNQKQSPSREEPSKPTQQPKKQVGKKERTKATEMTPVFEHPLHQPKKSELKSSPKRMVEEEEEDGELAEVKEPKESIERTDIIQVFMSNSYDKKKTIRYEKKHEKSSAYVGMVLDVQELTLHKRSLLTLARIDEVVKSSPPQEFSEEEIERLRGLLKGKRFEDFDILSRLDDEHSSTYCCYLCCLKDSKEHFVMKVMHNFDKPNQDIDSPHFKRLSNEGQVEAPAHPHIIPCLHSIADTVDYDRLTEVSENLDINLVSNFTVFHIYPKHSRTLKSYLREEKEKISDLDVMIKLEQLLNGICHLQDHKITHRNLSPSTVFIQDSGSLGIGDFGEHTKCSDGFKIPVDSSFKNLKTFFTAPETLEGKKESIDFSKSDVYSVGAIGYRMLQEEEEEEEELCEFAEKTENRFDKRVLSFIRKLILKNVEERPDCYEGWRECKELIQTIKQENEEISKTKPAVKDPPRSVIIKGVICPNNSIFKSELVKLKDVKVRTIPNERETGFSAYHLDLKKQIQPEDLANLLAKSSQTPNVEIDANMNICQTFFDLDDISSRISKEKCFLMHFHQTIFGLQGYILVREPEDESEKVDIFSTFLEEDGKKYQTPELKDWKGHVEQSVRKFMNITSLVSSDYLRTLYGESMLDIPFERILKREEINKEFSSNEKEDIERRVIKNYSPGVTLSHNKKIDELGKSLVKFEIEIERNSSFREPELTTELPWITETKVMTSDGGMVRKIGEIIAKEESFRNFTELEFDSDGFVTGCPKEEERKFDWYTLFRSKRSKIREYFEPRVLVVRKFGGFDFREGLLLFSEPKKPTIIKLPMTDQSLEINALKYGTDDYDSKNSWKMRKKVGEFLLDPPEDKKISKRKNDTPEEEEEEEEKIENLFEMREEGFVNGFGEKFCKLRDTKGHREALQKKRIDVVDEKMTEFENYDTTEKVKEMLENAKRMRLESVPESLISSKNEDEEKLLFGFQMNLAVLKDRKNEEKKVRDWYHYMEVGSKPPQWIEDTTNMAMESELSSTSSSISSVSSVSHSEVEEEEEVLPPRPSEDSPSPEQSRPPTPIGSDD